jgi:periplasmic protein TonB
MAALLGGGEYARGTTGRTLEYALVASLALHVALLVAFPRVKFATPETAPTPAPLVARLQPETPAPPPPPAVKTPEPRIQAPPPAPVPKAAPLPAPKPKAKPERVSRPVARTKPPVQTPPSPMLPAPAPAAAVQTAPAALPPPVASIAPARAAPEPTADRGDDAMLARYRLAVIEAARRYKRYPRAALDNNWNGKAEVHMAIGANGMIASMSIKSSSGYEILDRQALAMIRKAKPLTPIPASLRGRAFAVDIPVIFSLEEPDS